jgi:hypothetical protein
LNVVHAKAALDEAKGQLNTLSKEYVCGTPFSVCYVVPEVAADDKQDSREILHGLAGAFQTDGCFTAAYGPSIRVQNNGKLYPGVVLIARREELTRD